MVFSESNQSGLNYFLTPMANSSKRSPFGRSVVVTSLFLSIMISNEIKIK